MAVNIAGIRDSIIPTVGTKDHTVSGLGSASTHKGALLWSNYAEAVDTPTAELRYAFGAAVSQAHQFLTVARVNHGVTTSEHATGGVTRHLDRQGRCQGHYDTSSARPPSNNEFMGFITDGFQLRRGVEVSEEFLLHGLVFSGSDCSVDLSNPTVSLIEDGTVDVDIGFEPNLLIIWTQGDQFDDGSSHVGWAGLAMGFVAKNGETVTHVTQANGIRGSTLIPYATIRTDRSLIIWDPSRNQTEPDFEFTVSFPSSTTARITTNKVGLDPQAPEIGVLAMRFEGRSAEVGVMDVPTSTGQVTLGNSHFAPDVPFLPETLLWIVNNLTAVGVDRIDSAEAGVYGLAYATNPSVAAGHRESCMTLYHEQGQSTTNCGSLSADRLFHVPNDAGDSDMVLADIVSYVQGGIVADFTTAPGSALKFPYAAISGPVGSAWSPHESSCSEDF